MGAPQGRGRAPCPVARARSGARAAADESSTAAFLRVPQSRLHRQGVDTVGRGAVGIPLPMKKLGCGGWLYAVFCQASAVR